MAWETEYALFYAVGVRETENGNRMVWDGTRMETKMVWEKEYIQF